jgi:hypothetical protein
MNEHALYLVWSIEHDMWWRPDWQGYTPMIEEAGRYSLEEGRKILARANLVSVNECLIPVASVATLAYIIADAPRVPCDECEGRGDVLDAPANVLDGRSYRTPCPKCGGTGRGGSQA